MTTSRAGRNGAPPWGADAGRPPGGGVGYGAVELRGEDATG